MTLFQKNGELKGEKLCQQFKNFINNVILFHLDPASYGFWEESCGVLYLFGKSVV